MGFWDELGIDVKDLVPLLQNINANLQSINSRLAVSGAGSVSGAPVVIPTVRTQSFRKHLWVRAPKDAQQFINKYTVPNKVDAIAVTCPVDFQFEIDGDVNEQTPVLNAFQTPQFDIEVKEYITYRIQPSYIERHELNAKYAVPFYIYMFWYGD